MKFMSIYDAPRDEWPSRQELAYWEWLDETCEECGMPRHSCVCPPGCSCDPKEE